MKTPLTYQGADVAVIWDDLEGDVLLADRWTDDDFFRVVRKGCHHGTKHICEFVDHLLCDAFVVSVSQAPYSRWFLHHNLPRIDFILCYHAVNSIIPAREKEAKEMVRKSPQDFLDQIAFIAELPDSGGSWGQGVTMTLRDQVKEVGKLEEHLDALKIQIKDRVKLMRQMAGSAERNAQLSGFTQDQIDEAKIDAKIAAEKAAKNPPTPEGDGDDDGDD